MYALETYLRDLREIRSTGAAVKETSYYPSLANLLNAAGQALKPRVRCVMNLKNQGAGMPDGGLFTPDQFQRGSGEPRAGQPPSRGAIECKGTKDDAWLTTKTEQVSKYWNKYRQILVTNYRDFVLIGQDPATNRPVILETYRLAPSDREFWAASPSALSATHGERFLEYLKRVFLHAAVLADPKDVAWFLASYAREAKARMDAVELPALATVRKALEESLGLTFEGEKGEHFFRSTLVQTLFYGVFSAWVLWHHARPKPDQPFDWEKAPHYLHVPILRKLFRELADPQQMEEWRLTEVLGWTGAVLNRIDRDAFFARFQEAEAVQYFYEPFLEAFDPELRKQLGVWYTPPEVVRYMVARVDAVLREELGRPDGLADKAVHVLDPCCGTGAYLVEVLRSVAATLRVKGEDALLAGKLKEAATTRIFGFEILPAPFVVSHLQVGRFLQAEGAPLDESKKERAGIYLTNALTGWEPPKGPKQRFLYKEMQEEHDKAEQVKREAQILVVLGNPPYNGLAGVSVGEEADLANAYRAAAGDLRPQGQGLNDRTGKLTPQGAPDPSVFSTEHNREGIQVGTAIAILVRKRGHRATDAEAVVRFRDLWGQRKPADLVASLRNFGPQLYTKIEPAPALALPFRPLAAGANYLAFPSLAELFPVNFPGVFTARDSLVVDIGEEELRQRMTAYFDPAVSHEEMEQVCPQAMQDANSYDPIPTRQYLQKRGFLADKVVRYDYRPLDQRWLYWEPETKLLNRNRTEYFGQVFDGNIWLAATKQNRKEFDPPPVLRRHASLHIIERGANLFPLFCRELPEQGIFRASELAACIDGDSRANLSDAALSYLTNTAGGPRAAPQLFHHVIAVLHARAYAAENAGALRQDWPRVPLPANTNALRASAELGRQVAKVLDIETTVPGVVSGKVRPELKVIAVVSRLGGGGLNIDAGELAVTARWGISGNGGVTMPGKGRAEPRAYTPEERVALGQGAAALRLDEATALACLGESTFDVYLNDVAFWRNVPAKVWAYTLGGYQVMKKWLSYRERALLGRGLTLAEVEAVRDMARRIAALLLLGPALDANYQAVKTSPYPWGQAGGVSPGAPGKG